MLFCHVLIPKIPNRENLALPNMAGSGMCRKLGEALTEEWRAGPEPLGNTSGGEDTFLVRSVFPPEGGGVSMTVQTGTDPQPTVSAEHLGLEENVEAPTPSGCGEMVAWGF